MPDSRAPTTSSQTHNLFFACVPPDDIKSQLAEAWQSAGTGEDFRHDTCHLSLQAVAVVPNLDPILVERSMRAPLALRTAPFDLCFDRLMTFNGPPGNGALVLATDGRDRCANDLAVELHHALRAVGLTPPGRRKVTPHVTAAYGPGFPGVRSLAKPISWTVRDICLIDSLHGEGRHVTLGTWPLLEGREHPSFDF